MPFKSKAQRKFLFAKHPDIAKRWASEYGKGKENLPEHVDDRPSVKGLRAAAKK